MEAMAAHSTASSMEDVFAADTEARRRASEIAGRIAGKR